MFRNTAQGWSPCAAGPCPFQKEVVLNDRGQKLSPPFILLRPQFKSNTLTRKLPFAQVLGFALLAARHVGLVAALQLSSHWEVRSYKVDSKWSVFIDVSGIQREEQKQQEWSADHADSEEERAADCADLFMTFSQIESDGGHDEAPWAASSSADVTFLRTWTSGDGRTETYTTWAGRSWPVGGGTSHNKNQWTMIMDYLWKKVGEGWGGPWRHQWTEGIEGAGLRGEEREREVNYPWKTRSRGARRSSRMWSSSIHIH